MYIQINASDFAKYTGHNTHVDKREQIECFWCSNKHIAKKLGLQIPKRKRSHIDECLTPSVEQAVRDSLGLSTNATTSEVADEVKKRVVTPAVQASTNAISSSTIREHITQLTNSLDTETSSKIITILEKAATKDTQIRRGVCREKSALNRCETNFNQQIVERNSKFYKKTLFSWNNYDIVLVGKVDGMLEDCVVETKERRNRLFHTLVDYERVQVHCYMWLTGTKRAILHETFDETFMDHEITFDDDFWADCSNRLTTFLSNISEISVSDI